jgi:hypothetical protein
MVYAYKIMSKLVFVPHHDNADKKKSMKSIMAFISEKNEYLV